MKKIIELLYPVIGKAELKENKKSR